MHSDTKFFLFLQIPYFLIAVLIQLSYVYGLNKEFNWFGVFTFMVTTNFFFFLFSWLRSQ